MMTRTPDEIKKGLECCVDVNIVCAGNCVFDDDVKLGYPDCVKLLMTNALTLIQQLQAENAQQARCIENMTDKLNAMNDEVAKLQAERDAAVRDMTEIVQNLGDSYCEYCKNWKPGTCPPYCRTHSEGFRWRGVQKEERP